MSELRLSGKQRTEQLAWWVGRLQGGDPGLFWEDS
jgi:hypothetical protein